MWWLLRTIGFDRAALLDGGLKKWRVRSSPVHRDHHLSRRCQPDLNDRRGLLTGRDGVLQGQLLVDFIAVFVGNEKLM